MSVPGPSPSADHPATRADAPAHAIATAVRAGAVRAEDVVAAALARITRHDRRVNAFTDVLADRALSEARTLDIRVAAGQDPGPLAGVPVAVKNLVDLADLETRAGRGPYPDRAPATTDAVVVARLRAVGAVPVGALNMGELAYDFTGENAHAGDTLNPHDLARRAGGSSSGSGAALAAGMVPLTLGTDTNGSIRVPSSWCGVFGLKPTYGRVPRTGTFPFVDSLDHVGPMARTTRDVALALDALAGYDSGDPAAQDLPAPGGVAALAANGGVAGLRIAVAGGYFALSGDPEMATERDAMARVCAALGATASMSWNGVEEARAAAAVITAAEGTATHYDLLSAHPESFGEPVRGRLFGGALVPAIAYVKAQRLRRRFAAHAAAAFRDLDAVLVPAVPFRAPRIDSDLLLIDGIDQPYWAHIGRYTQPLSLTGLPILCAPVTGTGPLPVGVQIVTAPWREDIGLRIAQALERLGVLGAPLAPWAQEADP